MARLPAALLTLRPPSWRVLAGFWLLVLALVAGTGLVLAWLGPPEAQLAAEQPAAAAPPSEVAAASPPAPPPEIPPPAVTPVAADPVVIPRADPALLEPGPFGPLPRLGPEGRAARQVYARPFDRADRRPRIGLVLGGLGGQAVLAEEAIRRLPPGVTLAFSPYASGAAPLVQRARDRGMEVLLALPLEPTGYPLNSPGDRALLTGQSPAQNADNLDWALSRLTGYVGAIGALGAMRGERYAALGERLGALQEALDRRGLLYLDPRPGAPPPARAWGRTVDLVIDDPPNRAAVEAGLAGLEQLAQERGTALGYVGEATPVLLDRLAAWAGSLESRGSVLVPVSALALRPGMAAAH